MNLTSLNRVKNALGVTSTDSDAVLSRLISAASKRIAFYLRREDAIKLESRPQYFNPTRGQSIFRLKAYPVASIASVYSDSTGLYTGSQSLIAATDYLIGADNKTLWFNSTAGINNPLLQAFGGVYPKSLKVTYTGGLAVDGVSSTWTKTADVGGTLTVGYFILGAISGAVGKLTAAAAGTLSYENIYGVFQPLETITEYKELDNALSGGRSINDATGVVASLTACTAQSLAEAHPDLTEAAEMYVRHLFKNRDHMGNTLVSRDGETRPELRSDSVLTPEVRELADTYRNRHLG